jgi:hypothetical protein
MPTPAYKMVEEELMFLGDILAIGILKKGLAKVNSMPDIATPSDLMKAMDAHVEGAMVSFVGPNEARQRSLKVKKDLQKMVEGGQQ